MNSIQKNSPLNPNVKRNRIQQLRLIQTLNPNRIQCEFHSKKDSTPGFNLNPKTDSNRIQCEFNISSRNVNSIPLNPQIGFNVNSIQRQIKPEIGFNVNH